MVGSPEFTFHFCPIGPTGPGTLGADQRALHPDSARRARGQHRIQSWARAAPAPMRAAGTLVLRRQGMRPCRRGRSPVAHRPARTAR